MSITAQDDFNLTSARFFATGNIHDLFRRMRSADPVHWTQGSLKRGFWSIFKHSDALQIHKGASRYFSNAKFSIGLPSSSEVEAAATPDSIGANRSLIASDGELHRDFREAFHPMFVPTAVQRYEPLARECAIRTLESALDRGRCEFVTDVAAQLPMMIICEMMGIPNHDWQGLFELVNQAMEPEDEEYRRKLSAQTARDDAWRRLTDYCIELALKRRGDRSKDLVSAIANARVLGGRALLREELGFNGLMFLVGGLDTTRHAISGGLLQFILNPLEMRRLREDMSLLSTAVEEILRWTSPVAHSLRVALKDIELRGRRIKEGDWVVVWNPSVNRDEAVFPAAEVFDIGRHPNEHLAFAHGEHFCLGAHLARLEIRVIFEELFRRVSKIELDGEAEWVASNVFHGMKRLPVRLTKR
jgi:cytochrome P450